MWRLPLRLAAGVAVALCGALAAAASSGKAGPGVGELAPDFRSRDAVTHQPIRLSEQTGKVVVLTFWATWCKPCREEVPILENLQNKVDKDRLIVLAVPFHEPDRAYSELVKIFRSWKLTLVDDPSGRIAASYRIDAIPHLYVIGRDGRIAGEHKGYGEGSVQDLVADVNAALAVHPADPALPAGSPPADH